MGWAFVKADAHWGVNPATRAVEDNVDVEAIILFKGNNIPIKNISVLAIKRTNVHMGYLSEAVRCNTADMAINYAA
ncbi:hypothetical protein, conserved [Babesia ovata]|uniref:Uncharacterized protein n=1 Tax=Babesia ovata TaxID=189622 RepID=A0A2H6KEL1_9APIC|nr:uncharacterized protein BOVATA_029190 [Babesia ovata]GBE61426.1 hypothetical protein, conserved [Babesia ovata]